MTCCNQEGEPSKHTIPMATNVVLPNGDGISCLKFVVPYTASLHIHDDGSIEYEPGETEPRPISGYERDPNNPFLFHPIWPECPDRYHGLKPRGKEVDVVMVCNHTEAHPGEFVSLSACLDCPVRILRTGQASQIS